RRPRRDPLRPGARRARLPRHGPCRRRRAGPPRPRAARRRGDRRAPRRHRPPPPRPPGGPRAAAGGGVAARRGGWGERRRRPRPPPAARPGRRHERRRRPPRRPTGRRPQADPRRRRPPVRTHPPSGAQGWPGWEAAAVPPEKLGAYLRDFEALMADHGVDGLLYGHFGDGCMHVRIDMPLDSPEGIAPTRDFLVASAELVTSYGGSLSGEHGDGRARGELLPLMYSPGMIDLFGQVKTLFDPAENLNPGVLVRPQPLTAALRRPYAKPLLPVAGGFTFHEDGG